MHVLLCHARSSHVPSDTCVNLTVFSILQVHPGPDGYKHFTDAIRRAFCLPGDSELNITFTCDEPTPVDPPATAIAAAAVPVSDDPAVGASQQAARPAQPNLSPLQLPPLQLPPMPFQLLRFPGSPRQAALQQQTERQPAARQQTGMPGQAAAPEQLSPAVEQLQQLQAPPLQPVAPLPLPETILRPTAGGNRQQCMITSPRLTSWYSQTTSQGPQSHPSGTELFFVQSI